MIKKVLKWGGIALGGLVGLSAIVVGVLVAQFQSSLSKHYDVALPQITRSSDPAVLARGQHLVESLGACQGCHGGNLGGGNVEEFGPLGRIRYPNITGGRGGRLAEYTDAELARLLWHGIRRDGTTTRFMPSVEFAWWPQEDVVAVISYLRTVPPVDGQPADFQLGLMAKVLDRLGMIQIDIARRIDHEHPPQAPRPEPTARYGAFIARACEGCHGPHLSGGPIPGAGASLPVPLNLTPDPSGLQDCTFEQFERVIRQGLRRNGERLNPFMPIGALGKLNDTEMRALWAYLRTLPPRPFGQH